MLANDPLDRVLIVDLTKRRATVERRPDLFASALGGVGVATRLLAEECPDGADPLGPENPIILAVGPLSGLFPMASKTVAMFKSPHNGSLGESHAGGRSAVAIRMAGYGAIIIRGASSSPIYLVIEGDKVHFRDTRAMWGMHCAYAAGSIIRDREAGAGTRTDHAHRPRGREVRELCLGDHGDLPAFRAAGPRGGLREQEAEGAGRLRDSIVARCRPEALSQDLR